MFNRRFRRIQFPVRMTGQYCLQNIIIPTIVPLRNALDGPYIFMDQFLCLRALVRQIVENYNIYRMDKTALSTDLNPLEYMCGIIYPELFSTEISKNLLQLLKYDYWHA